MFELLVAKVRTQIRLQTPIVPDFEAGSCCCFLRNANDENIVRLARPYQANSLGGQNRKIPEPAPAAVTLIFGFQFDEHRNR